MYRILVVDDEKNIADNVAATLEAGIDVEMEVSVCYGTASAEDFSRENLVDIIICDINMPGESGLALCKKLSLSGNCPEIIFLTGYSDFSYTYEALKLPDASYVLKLEDDSVLLNEIKRKIEKIDRERRKRLELAAERMKNRELQAELHKLQLSDSVHSDSDFSWDGFVFLVAKFFTESSRCQSFETYLHAELNEEAVYVFADGVYLVGLNKEIPRNIFIEKAKRIQQGTFEAEAVYSVFVIETSQAAGSTKKRFYELKAKAERQSSDGILYFFAADLPAKGENFCIGEDDYVIKFLMKYIEGHLEEDLSLIALSDMVHYNPSYLSRRFKQATKLNISMYITGRRLEYAKKLLSESDLLIKDVATRCGFPNPTRFGIAFVKKTGMAPNVFRMKNASKRE